MNLLSENKGILKLNGWQPQPKPNEDFCQKIRDYVKQAIFSKWNNDGKFSSLLDIYRFVTRKVKEDIETGRWPKSWKPPGKRTVDRRVNEVADPRFYDDHIPKIVSVTAGVYTVNPKLFSEESP